jgi:TRAP-type C4-dicarboxylate transport system substrate-binding protein
MLRLAGVLLALWVALPLFTTSAFADPITLRLASIAPEGTAWARELKAFGRDVETVTNGEVRVKWVLGGIAGDDAQAGERIARGQLDGMAAGAWQCERWAPTLAVTRLPGLFRSRAEAAWVETRLRPQFDEEFRRSGFVHIGDSQLGPSVVFLRQPVRSLDELKRVKLWTLDIDTTKSRLLGGMGFTLVPLPFDRSRQAFDAGEADGFLAPPTGAMAFQWSTQARYVLDLPTDWIISCVLISNRAFDRLSIENQRSVRSAGAKLSIRVDDVSATADRQLLGGLFARQGLQMLPVDDKLRADFLAAGRASWKLVEARVPAALLQKVEALLEEYRRQPTP